MTDDLLFMRNDARIPPIPTQKVEGYKETDFLTESGAEKLCQIIKAAWAKAGHPDVTARPERVVTVRTRHDKGHYTIRTNLIAGLPPGLWR
jgi:hypothetical protein